MKRVLYITSSRHRFLLNASTDEVYARWPHGMGAILFHLQEMGWESRRIGFWQACNPWKLARVIRAFRPTVIWTYGLTWIFPAWARRLSGWHAPILHGWEDCNSDIWANIVGRWFGRLVNLVEKPTVCRADFVVSAAFDLCNRARAWGRPVQYIPNGADLPEFDPAKCKFEMTGKMNVVHVGDQSRHKHTEDVVKVMAGLPKEIKLYLVGVPNPALLKYASDNVIFTGFVSYNDLWTILSRADVAVNTSHQDVNGKLSYYLRMKKPILAWDGKANLMFKNRENALLTRDYAAALLELYRSPELRQRLAENAARDIPVPTWREVAEQYDRLFAEIGARHDPARG
jgi:glycosyltransferase involved in cell wall biosynthesis